jgi:hypothetical protein
MARNVGAGDLFGGIGGCFVRSHKWQFHLPGE